ncbi:hypothetical protein U0070_014946 [Myodes glareolus]|uniref:Uncharacterized protein n=1 Tax=Myodes glareolus TaxID=447135 RepID=A0AAW0I1T3_MYOGA
MKTLGSWSWRRRRRRKRRRRRRRRRKVSWSLRTWSYWPGTEGECSKKELGDKACSISMKTF